MKSFECRCGNTIFFENTLCLSCGSELGWCPACQSMTALLPGEDAASFHCGREGCGAPLAKCHNYAVENVCNRCCRTASEAPAGNIFCDYCRFNRTIPDLGVPGNREKWFRLEAAKRRLLYTLDLLGLPYGNESDGIDPPLSFDFKEDVPHPSHRWWTIGDTERVYTGHLNGRIVLNLREADTIEREKARVVFQEAHRTLIGHFRHEIGHYYWQMLVQCRLESDCKDAFGDHEQLSYAEAKERYYRDGPPPDWKGRFISAYSSLHPLEDFAETFAAYLDMVSVLDTALHMGFSEGVDPTRANLESMVACYIRLGVLLNEMNRAMGLLDLVPDVLVPPVIEKLGFVHELVRAARRA